MKSPPTFQIKVALIGNVSAGKTTVLNALFRDKYGQVSMKRTTAGVNEFAVCNRTDSWALVADEPPRDSHSILTEITQDNVELRASDQVQTKRFEIELEEPLCEMRKDTQLVIVDIPGINEANASEKYKTYVEDNWSTFDCVVVVMDGRHGVNTECQVSLLQLVKSNLESKKNVPVVILCNKIDDQDDEEQAELVLEAQKEIEKIFQVSDRHESLQEVLDACGVATNETARSHEDVSPVFIPISGITAFIFQTCSNMSLERFREFNEKLIAKLGRDRIGKFRWKKLSKEQQIKDAHEAVSDPEGYQEGVSESNFDKFLIVLSFLIGGQNVQQQMIKEQIQVSLATMSNGGPGIVQKLEIEYKKLMTLSQGDSSAESSTTTFADVKSTFWRLYKGMEQDLLTKKPSTVLGSFRPLADELKSYRTFAMTAGWKSESDLAVSVFKNAVRRLLENMASTPGFAKDLRVVHSAVEEFLLDAQGVSPKVQIFKATFEKLFENLAAEAFGKFTPNDIFHRLSLLADELIVYNSLAIDAGWTHERLAVGEKFEDLVRRQISTLCKLANDCSQRGFGYHNSPKIRPLCWWSSVWKEKEVSVNHKSSEAMSFTDFSWLDWKLGLRSILLLRHDHQFCLDFGREVVLIECLLESDPRNRAMMELDNEQCPRCNSNLTFNRECNKCLALVSLSGGESSNCFRTNCSGTLQEYGAAKHGWSRYSCNRCSCSGFRIQESGNNEVELKHFCPNCSNQELDYNRRCGKCLVFFRPANEHKASSVCPYDQYPLDPSTGSCDSCGNVWKSFPKSLSTGCVQLQCDGNTLALQKRVVDVPSSLSDPNHFGHLAWKYCEFMKMTLEKSFNTAIVITNLPKVPNTKLEKLTKVVIEVVSKIGTLDSSETFSGVRMPHDEVKDTTLGFCFVRFYAPEDAKHALVVLDGYKFDKIHTISVSPYSRAAEWIACAFSSAPFDGDYWL